MSKVVIGTDNIHGTCFNILDLDLLTSLFNKDKDYYFHHLGNDLSFFLSIDDTYAESTSLPYMPTCGAALIVDGEYYALQDDDNIRSDTYFISLLETIGIENVETKFGGKHLRIINIPDDVKWFCYYPDLGPMYIREVSRTWYGD